MNLHRWRHKSAAFALTDGRVALWTFFAALIVYLSNASLLPFNPDTLPNVYMSASVLAEGDLAFSPFEAPSMFLWSAKGTNGEQVGVPVTRWTQVPPGSAKSYAEHYREGRLKFNGSKYYLVPTVRERPETGEPQFVSTFGPAVGLTTLPLAILAHVAGVRLYENSAAALGIAKLTAALLAAGSVALICLTAVEIASRGRARAERRDQVTY